MANEITTISRLAFTKGNLALDRNVTSRITMGGTHFSENVQTIPTTSAGTALVIAAAVATLGFAFFRNNDGTNFIQVGVQVSGTFYPLIKIKPGETAGPVRLTPGITVYARADTASADLENMILED